jgi:Type II CAAX prenyl endopeptidase Rce1-like
LRRFTLSTLDDPPFLVTVTYLGMFLVALFIYAVTHDLGGGHMLLSIKQLEKNGFSAAGLGKVWFIFAWALAAPLFFALLGYRTVSDDPRDVQFAKGLWVSLHAGVFEELMFRGYLFLAAMVVESWINFFGIEKWLVTNIDWPIANFLTFHAFHNQVAAHPQWIFAGAITTAAMWFSKGHKHLGWVGAVNSWFIGMVMFFLVLNYGLLTAIVAHVLYDVIVFTVYAITSEREYGSPVLRALVQESLNRTQMRRYR